jgi:dynamin 1-like protein
MEQLIPIVAKLQDVLGAVGGDQYLMGGAGAGSASDSTGRMSSGGNGNDGQFHHHMTDSMAAAAAAGNYLNLPQIVVVGGQSSGKSSVLEAIVGRSFLPRGSGIVTRRPLILQLYNTALPKSSKSTKDDENDDDIDEGIDESEANDDEREDSASKLRGKTNGKAKGAAGRANEGEELLPGDEWGEFLHKPAKKYYDFSEIRDEIVRETERLTGRNKGISAQPLSLKIFSPRVLQLTLVDLPGVAKIALGDQPLDIEDQIRNMCLHYISNPNAIILAVTAANTDLANSDAIKLAHGVDPLGERTVGVLTKLDLMDPGTDASDMLLNKVIPLRRGYIGVVNRGQLDIERETSIQEGLQKEEDFFRTHPAYNRSLAPKCGTGHLAKTLNVILMHHIRQCLPELKNRILHMVSDVQIELDALGTPSDASQQNLGASLLNLLSKFAASFANCVNGKGSSPDGLEMNELFGGARIGFIFNEVFVRSLMSVEPFDGLSDNEIRTTIANANGTRAALFVPEISFDILVRRQISRLEQPGLQCVDLVFDELQKIGAQCEPIEFQRFPLLRDRMMEVVARVLRGSVSPTQVMVSNLIKIEMSYINTSHPDFIGGSRAVAKLMERMSKDLGSNGNTTNSNPNNNNPNPNLHVATSSNHSMNGGAGNMSHASSTGYGAAATTKQPNNQQQQAATVMIDEAAEYDTPFSGSSPIMAEEDTSGGGGIMNYLFGGNKRSSDEMPLRYSNQPRNINNQYNPYASPSRTGVSTVTGAGPPTVVQLPQVPDTMRQADLPTERERVETEIIKSLIESYFAIVQKNFIDMVPKTIMHFLVNESRDTLQNELVSQLYRESMISDLMQEADDIAQRRKTCQEMRDLLKKALEIVNEVRDFNTFV